MTSSKPKLSIPESYSDYFIQTEYHPSHDTKPIITHYKARSHKRKTSQVSNISCKSKQRNTSFGQNREKRNHSANKPVIQDSIVVLMDTKTHKTTKASEKCIAHRKQFSVQKNRISIKNKNTLSIRREKLKLDTSRKPKPKTVQNLTSRYISHDSIKPIYNQTTKHQMSQSSFVNNKCNPTDSKTSSNKKIHDNEKTLIPKFKLRQKNLELLVSRCSHVMTEYYERITLLRKENDMLRVQNEELKKNILNNS